MRSRCGVVWVLAIGISAASLATVPGVILINNGDEPPEPLNVIDASDPWASDEVIVRNAGCGTPEDPHAFCDFPGSSTRVEVVAGGEVGSVTIREGSGLTVSGGSVGTVLATDGAAVLTTGGAIDALTGIFSANIVLAGGTVTSAASRDEALIGVNKPTTVSGLVGLETGEIRVFGGTVSTVLVANESSSIAVHGGTIEADLEAFDTGSITVFGLDFRIDGTPVEPGEIAALSGVLTGELDSSEPIDTAFVRDPTARIELVPEPSAAGLLAAALAALLAASLAARLRAGSPIAPSQILGAAACAARPVTSRHADAASFGKSAWIRHRRLRAAT